MKWGHRTKSAALRALDGSRERPRHRTKVEPQPEAGAPQKPSYVAADGALSAAWDRFAAVLEGEKRLTVSEAAYLENLVRAYGEWQKWRTLSDDSPLILNEVDKRGNLRVKPHPAHQQERLASESFRKLLTEGGLTPISRARVSMGASSAAKPESPLAKLKGLRRVG